MLSATYRQAALGNPLAAAAATPTIAGCGARVPLRLEAEAVRDAMLAVAGELNPAARRARLSRLHARVFAPARTPTSPTIRSGPTFNRRSIYRVWTRGGRSGLLDAFDCPDPSTTAPKRAVTTTPLQALALLNNSFVLRMSERFAARLERDAGDNVTRQVARAYSVGLWREPVRRRSRGCRACRRASTALPCWPGRSSTAMSFLYVD